MTTGHQYTPVKCTVNHYDKHAVTLAENDGLKINNFCLCLSQNNEIINNAKGSFMLNACNNI